jgi:riboflavin synthase
MFTGLVGGTGTISGKRSAGGGMALDFLADFDLTDPEEGESIAISGVCLTAYNINDRKFTADVSPETLARTKLGTLAPGQRVNLERALRLSDRLGGHLVSGHVDCLAKVKGIEEIGEYTLFDFTLPGEQTRYIVEKGSVAIDGISLTVNSCGRDSFSVSIIPHTLKMTTLGDLRIGSVVNIEVDIVGKYIEKLLLPRDDHRGETKISPDFLAQHGFM